MIRDLNLLTLKDISERKLLPKGYWDRILSRSDSEDTAREDRKRKEAGVMIKGMTLRQISDSRILINHCKNYWRQKNKPVAEMSLMEKYRRLQIEINLRKKERGIQDKGKLKNTVFNFDSNI